MINSIKFYKIADEKEDDFMITLKDITLHSFASTESSVIPSWQRTLENYGVYDCQTLYDLMMTRKLEFQEQKFYSIIATAAKLMGEMNSKDIDPDVYSFEQYIRGKDEKLYLQSDAITTADRLPTLRIESIEPTYKKTSNLDIRTIRYLLGKITLEGRNGIYLHFSPRTKIKQQCINGLIMYYEHLDRIIKTLPEGSTYRGALLDKDRLEKYAIVSKNIAEIIQYLLENGDTFIWGTFSARRRKDILSSLQHERENANKTRIASVVTDYTTLGELKKDPLDPTVLKRFILKPKENKKG